MDPNLILDKLSMPGMEGWQGWEMRESEPVWTRRPRLPVYTAGMYWIVLLRDRGLTGRYYVQEYRVPTGVGPTTAWLAGSNIPTKVLRSRVRWWLQPIAYCTQECILLAVE